MRVQTLLLPLVILILIGLLAFSFLSRGTITAEVEIRETEIANLEATIVNVFDDQRVRNGTATAQFRSLEDQIEILSISATEASQSAVGDVSVDVAGTPETNGLIDEDAPPQVRIRLREIDTIRSVGNPIDIIASAAHPIGIAVLNLTINGETVFTDSPSDPRMDIVTLRWTPDVAGSYEIEAIATTVRGRASTPVSIQLDIVEETASEDLMQIVLRQIEEGVRNLRGLEQIEAVEINMIDRFDFQESITVDLLSDFTREDARDRVHVLSAFDFVPPDYPLYDTMISLYGGVVAGYYDDVENALYVVNSDDTLDEEERLTHAHEYMHALQDQHFGLSFLLDESMSADEILARRSLAEGEATLLEFLFRSRGYLTGEQNADSNPVFPTPNAQQAPNFLVDELSFPYVRGSAFLATFFDDGEFEAVNRIWADPPISSEQVIHPERYASGDDPIEVELPVLDDLLGEAWRLVEENVFGEFYFIQYLSLGLEDQDQIATASEGWGGDRYRVYLNESTGEKLMLLQSEWDSPADLMEFKDAYRLWLENFELEATDLIDGEGVSGDLACYEIGRRIQCLFHDDDQLSIIRGEDAVLLSDVLVALDP